MDAKQTKVKVGGNDLDEGSKYLQDHLDTSNELSKQSRELLTKIDTRLIPVMAVAYTLCFLDRAILNVSGTANKRSAGDIH